MEKKHVLSIPSKSLHKNNIIVTMLGVNGKIVVINIANSYFFYSKLLRRFEIKIYLAILYQLLCPGNHFSLVNKTNHNKFHFLVIKNSNIINSFT